GTRHDVDVDVIGCAVNRAPTPPWGRPITPPGAPSCTIELRWGRRAIDYPAALDPAWTTTKGMTAVGHLFFTPEWGMDVLSTGLALIAGGSGLATAELFDPATGTWATTGSLGQGTYSGSLAAVAGGRALFVVGHVAWLYDVSTGVWTS